MLVSPSWLFQRIFNDEPLARTSPWVTNLAAFGMGSGSPDIIRVSLALDADLSECRKPEKDVKVQGVSPDICYFGLMYCYKCGRVF